MENAVLFSKLNKSIIDNDKGGFACYWNRLRVLFPILLQKMKINREVRVPLFFGDKMNVITGEIVSTNIISFSYSEIALTAIMLKLIGPGQLVVDIGTHFGYEALLASRLVGENGRVVCFEPIPATFKLAAKNLQRPNVQMYNHAVGAANGTVKMQNKPIVESAFNGISTDLTEADLIDIPLVTLDSVLAGRDRPVNFIKCDVEGFEMEVLKGSTNILKEDKPILALEADMPSPTDNSTKRADEIAAFLLPYGYRGYTFDLTGSTLKIGALNSFKVYHANILFVHQSKSAMID